MKKLLLLSFVALSIGADAQITITTADIATPTKVIYQANDTMPTISVGSPGTGLNWNMVALNNHTEDTMTFLPYSAAPNPKFSTANLLVKQGWQAAYAYAINNASGLTILGNSGTADFGAGPSQINQINSPVEILTNFPSTYNSNFTNDYVQRATFFFGVDPGLGVVIDSLRTTSAVHKTVVYDGWGTITTPLGSYSALRAKEIIVKHDTTDAYIGFAGWQNAMVVSADSSASYVWWANSIGFPLVQARMDSLGAVTEVQWLLALPTPVGINEFTAAATVNVYPNPAQDQINFATDAKSVKTIQVYDLTGRQVDAFSVTSDISTIITSNYANGAYSYDVIGRDNTVLGRGKFAIAK